MRTSGPRTYGHARAKERPVWLLFLARGLKVFLCFFFGLHVRPRTYGHARMATHVQPRTYGHAHTGTLERRNGLCGCCFWLAVWKFFFFFGFFFLHVRAHTYGHVLVQLKANIPGNITKPTEIVHNLKYPRITVGWCSLCLLNAGHMTQDNGAYNRIGC